MLQMSLCVLIEPGAAYLRQWTLSGVMLVCTNDAAIVTNPQKNTDLRELYGACSEIRDCLTQMRGVFV